MIDFRSIFGELMREKQKSDKALRVLNHRRGPGRETYYTLRKGVERSQQGGWRGREKPKDPWAFNGQYVLAVGATRAIRRFARWMAANPTAKTNREAPFHIIRNAAKAQAQLAAAKKAGG